MKQTVLIFTFGPIQPFIMEARRPADLYAGSQILVRMAASAAEVFRTRGELIYPAKDGSDTPNKMVTVISGGKELAAEIANQAAGELRERWNRIARAALADFRGKNPFLEQSTHDPVWKAIWDRQVNYPWEIYWTACEMDEHSNPAKAYADAYRLADQALDGIKRLREFNPSPDEAGMKDSLSGKRQALLIAGDRENAKNYWNRVATSPGVSPAQVRPGGQERLDTIGLIKRFWPAGFSAQGYPGFPSTSSIAGHFYREKLIRDHPSALQAYRDSLASLNPWQVRQDRYWPYDDDFLYPNCLDNLEPSAARTAAEAALKKLWKAAGMPPAYYAIIVFDGDRMGARIQSCLDQSDPKQAHQEFSGRLTEFSMQVPAIITSYGGFPVYNGGDDVLYFCPLETALPSAHRLSEAFLKTGSTASAGIAIVHRAHPMGAALSEARQAEGAAKQYPGRLPPTKDAVCIRAVKRSGAPLKVAARWTDLPAYVEQMIGWFEKTGQVSPVSQRFAYEWKRNTYALPESGPMVQWELNRLLDRHRNKDAAGAPEAAHWAVDLDQWAETLPGGSDHLADWILLARFIAQGGVDE